MEIKDWYYALRSNGHGRIVSLLQAVLFKVDSSLIKFK